MVDMCSLSKYQRILKSETWLNSEKGVDFDLNGYELNHMNRENKKGGSVALYVNKSHNYKEVESMTTSIDDALT